MKAISITMKNILFFFFLLNGCLNLLVIMCEDKCEVTKMYRYMCLNIGQNNEYFTTCYLQIAVKRSTEQVCSLYVY